MTTFQSRASRGIPAGGQFTPDVRPEPTVTLSDPAAQANLNRPMAQVTLTAEQAGRLHSKKTPLKDAMARRGVTSMPSMTETDDRIRSIQGRLNARA